MLIGAILCPAAFNFEILGSVGNQGAKVFNLGNGEVFGGFCFLFKEGLVFFLTDFVIFFIGLNDVFSS